MILIRGRDLTSTQLVEIAHGAQVELCSQARERMDKNHGSIPRNTKILEQKHRWILGDDPHDTTNIAREFILAHCAGVGDPLPVEVVRAAMAARCNVLAQGHSGCRSLVAQHLIDDLNAGIHPIVPSQGSVGAAGDLAPMAHIARVVCGYDGVSHDLPRLVPQEKEALALINGVSLSAAIAAIAVEKAWNVFEALICATACSMEVVLAQSQCLDERALKARGFPETAEIGVYLRTILDGSTRVHPNRQPDAFSIRSGPSVMGSCLRTLRLVNAEIHRELNGTSDNPLCFAGEWVEAGNFHGAAISTAMDHLRISLAQLGTLSERRTFRMTHGQLSENLPSFLIHGNGLNSGFMLAQYTAAALSSEMKGLAHPASVDSIPTVQHHEDHVSMAPIAARMTLEAVDCLHNIVSIELLLAAQGLDLRQRNDGLKHPPKIQELLNSIRLNVPVWEDDTVLYPHINALSDMIREKAFAMPNIRVFQE